jgi:hypothetical protein
MWRTVIGASRAITESWRSAKSKRTELRSPLALRKYGCSVAARLKQLSYFLKRLNDVTLTRPDVSIVWSAELQN